MAKMKLVKSYIRKTVKVSETLSIIEVDMSFKSVLEIHLSFPYEAMNTSRLKCLMQIIIQYRILFEMMYLLCTYITLLTVKNKYLW